MPKPLRIAFIGNCQVQTYDVLTRRMLPHSDVISLDFSEQASRDEALRRNFSTGLDGCDHIFLHTNGFSYTGEAFLEPLYPDRLVKIANFYFRGLHPDSCYVGDFEHRFTEPTAVNSLLVLEAFTRGLSEQEALEAFAPASYQRLGLFDAWRSSMEEMRRRDAQVDLAGAEIMEACSRRYPSFWTMNHPSIPFLKEYLGRVFDLLGIRWQDFDTAGMIDPMCVHDTVPIADEIAEHFRLPYRTTQRWKINSLNQRFVDRREFVGRFYAAYAAAPPERLKVHSPTDLVERLGDSPEFRHLVAEERR
ncbi:MAG: hypothetical protein JO264_11060 [Acidisphaera sp.]|nr:hypothetical protein [Acidisphaera sp.]